MTQLDLCIRGANVVDGTGAPMRRADVGIKDGRITSIGEHLGGATETLDADGLVLAPVSSIRTRITTRSSAGIRRPRLRTCTALRP